MNVYAMEQVNLEFDDVCDWSHQGDKGFSPTRRYYDEEMSFKLVSS
mgnify:CR=1 FL=1